MGFYPTYTAIFIVYMRSKLAYIRGLQGPIYTRAQMRVYATTLSYMRGLQNSAVYAGMKSVFLYKGLHVQYDASKKVPFKRDVNVLAMLRFLVELWPVFSWIFATALTQHWQLLETVTRPFKILSWRLSQHGRELDDCPLWGCCGLIQLVWLSFG